MNPPGTLFIAERTALAATFALLSFGGPCARASYYNLTHETPEPQECIIFDARYAYWTNGVYIAAYPLCVGK